ncbi:hypothetical protein WA171_003287 [Blastocystis sp. BT1]
MDNIESVPEVSAASLKGLGDKSYDRRKSAAQEITSVVSTLYKDGNVDKVNLVLKKLQSDYLRSPNVNNRNGALIAFASIAVALDTAIVDFFPVFLNSVLKCLDDNDSKVRYYSSEALYNIAKAAQTRVLVYFDQFFYALCQLFSDVDTDVKKISLLLKEIVTEARTLDLERIVPLLKQCLSMNNPYIRRLVVSWISVLDSKPGIDMLEYFPQLIDGLFLLLGDDHREIRIETDDILTSFLSEIKSSEMSPVVMNTIMNTLLTLSHHNDRFIRLTSVMWIYEFILLDDEWDLPYARMLRALLPCYADNEADIRTRAEACCRELLKSLQKKADKVELLPLIEVACTVLAKQHNVQCLVCLEMVNVLLKTRGNEVIANEHLRGALLDTLKEENDDVIDCDLKVLVKYVECSKDLLSLIGEIVEMLEKDDSYMEERGCLILRTLCKYMKAEVIFPLLATIIMRCKNLHFSVMFIQMLNVILLTADEAQEVRMTLKSCLLPSCSKKEGQDLFDKLFPAWCVNPFATLALCWLAEDYVVAYQITQSLASQEISLSMLLQADKLVQMLESPVFLHVRLQLLNTGSEQLAPLLQSLYGLLMILPQSSSYRLLQNRLSGVVPLYVILQHTSKDSELSESDRKRIELYLASNKEINVE